MTALEEFFTKIRNDVDKVLDELIPSAAAAPERLHQAIRWSVFSGGKRIRPALLFAAGRTFGAANGDLLRSAAAFEMIHTYSLIHDDLPAMDNDDLRRGKATCHRQFGEATAILAGDVLQTLAFKAIAEDRSLSAEVRLKLLSLLADASGTPFGMVAGQQLDLDAEGKATLMTDIKRIHRQKTGSLISAAAMAGAIIAGATNSELEVVERYAAQIGLLFQITDDLLDVTQLTTTLGKTAGKDAAANKATYPGIYGVEKTRVEANAIRKDALETLGLILKDTALLRDIGDMIFKRIR